jgi:hypothetical protein
MFSKSGNALSLSIQAGMNVGSSGHYCGKGCLMLDLNEMIDMINSEQRAVNCKQSQLMVHSSLLAEVIHGSLE